MTSQEHNATSVQLKVLNKLHCLSGKEKQLLVAVCAIAVKSDGNVSAALKFVYEKNIHSLKPHGV